MIYSDYLSICLEDDDFDFTTCHIEIGLRNLLFSMIELAFKDAIYSRIYRDQALAWIMSNDRRWMLSFLNACSLIGADPAKIRVAVNTYIATGKPKKRQARTQRA